MRSLTLIVLLALTACHRSNTIKGDTGVATDAIAEPDPEIVWECTVDEDCTSIDPCIAPACDIETHECTSTSLTGPVMAGDRDVIESSAYWMRPTDLVWAGSRLGLTWYDGRADECSEGYGPSPCHDEIYFMTVAVDGESPGTPSAITAAEARCSGPTLLWTGSEYGLKLYCQVDGSNRAYFARIDENGVEIGDEILLGHDGIPAYSADLTWTGSEYVLVWQEDLDDPETRDGTYLQSIGDDGVPDPAPIPLTAPDDPVRPDWGGRSDIAWTGSEISLTWIPGSYDEPGLYHTRVSLDGELSGPGHMIGSRNARWSSTILVDEALFILWEDPGNPPHDVEDDCYYHCEDVAFTLVSLEGGIVSSDIVIPWSNDNVIVHTPPVWTGSEITFSWNKDTGWGTESYLTRIDGSGEVIGEHAPLPADGPLAWTGSEYVLVWSEQHDEGWDLKVDRVVICE